VSTQIYEGTNQIQQVVIAKKLLGLGLRLRRVSRTVKGATNEADESRAGTRSFRTAR
jgi:hypothetical protein